MTSSVASEGNHHASDENSAWVIDLAQLRNRREKWCLLISEATTFAAGSEQIVTELTKEIAREGVGALGDHLLMAGIIPESFWHDTTAEKLYAKYTDHVITAAFTEIGCKAEVITERAGAADVIGGYGEDRSFVADAKAFRLSRTAKNQKDFKVEALAGWRKLANHACLVGPLSQYPSNQSQIYEQASRRDVCLLSYTHLRALTKRGPGTGIDAFDAVLQAPGKRDPEKSAATYWASIREALVGSDEQQPESWQETIEEEREAHEALAEVEIEYLRTEIERISGLGHDELAELLVTAMNLPGRLTKAQRAVPTAVFDF